MSRFADWLCRVLEAGESIQAEPPTVAAAERDRVDALLRSAFQTHALSVGGPRMVYDADAGFAAALTLAEACWQLVECQPDAAPPKNRVGSPRSAAAHLSADLTLRLLPAVYRRAKSRRDGDPLAAFGEKLLRRWPLSGVLADIPAGPDGGLDFHGHAGLRLLYAERLADHPRSTWVPADGPTRQQVERVFHQRGKPIPKPPTPAEAVP